MIEINTNLPSVIDFGLYRAIRNFSSPNGSVKGLYETLAKDFLYTDPNNLLTFADNHDIERIMYAAKSDTSKFKLALTFLLTTRGIPQIYYGTEIGMLGGRSHGDLREEFPGGFPDHRRSAFKSDGRTQLENDIYTFIKNLIHLRKEHTVFSNGSLIQFPPKDELYVYFRIDDNEKILVVINNNDEDNKINLDSFQKIIGNDPGTMTILSGNENIQLNKQIIKVKPKSAGIILIK